MVASVGSYGPGRARTSDTKATQRQRCPQFVPKTRGWKKEGLASHRRKSLCCKVPKRGLEPPLPLREPGPEPNGCPFRSQGIYRAVSQKALVFVPITSRARFPFIVSTGHSDGQHWRNFGGRKT